MSSATLLTKTYPKPVDAAIARAPDRDEPTGQLPVLTERGAYLLRIANNATSKWALR
jgi:hypothetical protein